MRRPHCGVILAECGVTAASKPREAVEIRDRGGVGRGEPAWCLGVMARLRQQTTRGAGPYVCWNPYSPSPFCCCGGDGNRCNLPRAERRDRSLWPSPRVAVWHRASCIPCVYLGVCGCISVFLNVSGCIWVFVLGVSGCIWVYLRLSERI